MRIRILMVIFICLASMFSGGCAELEEQFTPPTEERQTEVINDEGEVETRTEIVQTGDSPAVATGKTLAPLAGPYGELILGGIMLVQNAYLLKKRRDRKKQETEIS